AASIGRDNLRPSTLNITAPEYREFVSRMLRDKLICQNHIERPTASDALADN
ncbi:11605_t:CDS:2, partial [Funneliformis geosporum]